MRRTSSYPTNDGLNFDGIDFRTPVSQIDKLERQKTNFAINVFGWENEQVIVHRISEKDGSIPRINLMISKQGDNTHYSWVKRLTALLCDQNRHNESKHFCERCLHGYSRKDLLERHKPECKGLLKSPTRTEMLKEGENKMSITNYHKQMKAPYVIYANFECVLEKIDGCEPSLDASFKLKTEKHEPCGFSYIAVRSDGKLFGPFPYRGRDAVYVFLSWLQNHEREMREDMANKRPLVMTPEDWKNHRKATDCHICTKSLVKDLFLDSISVYAPETGKYCGQSQRSCCFAAMKSYTGPRRERQPKDAIDWWIVNTQETCLFCADPLLVANFKDSVKDQDHMTGKYRGAAHNECNFKLKLNAKTDPIPIIFHNMKNYDSHLLMQAMARVQGEIKCIPTNTEKYISFSLGNLRFIDSLNFMQSSLDKLVKGSDEFPIMQKTVSEENKRQPLQKKGIYPYEYMNSFERFDEKQLPEKEKFYSSLSGKGITDEEYAHAQEVWATFGCQTLGNYHDMYVATDVLLLADVFENFRKVCQEKYGLDPAHYYTAPGLSWDALLKKTGVELELLTDLDMHLFIERGMRGGTTMVGKRYANANNPLVEVYNPAEPTNYITYLDANNLYGWAMSLPLSKSGFHWKRVMPTEEQIMKMKWNAKKGWILEVDLEYPEELHDAHNGYPMVPEKRATEPWKMSEYQHRLMADLGLHKRRLVLNKPVYTGMTILENSKILMYDLYYNHLKARYGPRCDLIYTGTDSLLLHIQTEEVYKDMKEELWLYDTSNYPKDHPLYDVRNKKVLGKMKDECGGEPIEEVLALRPKMYSIMIKKASSSIKKAKGAKKM